MTTYTSKIPAQAVGQGQDLVEPTQDLLRSMNLLPAADATLGDFKYAFEGPPDSVSILEAGATAAIKGWSTLIGVSAAATSAWILKAWAGLANNSWNQPFALLAVAIVIAAATLGIAHLFAADVQGRALAMTATIDARRNVAIAMIDATAERFTAPASGPQDERLIGLPGLTSENADETTTGAEQGWRALAWRSAGGKEEFLLTKGRVTKWVDAQHVKIT